MPMMEKNIPPAKIQPIKATVQLLDRFFVSLGGKTGGGDAYMLVYISPYFLEAPVKYDPVRIFNMAQA